MSAPSCGQHAPRPPRRYRGSARRVRQISLRRNTPINLLIMFLLTVIALFVLLSWIGEHAE